MLVIVFANSSYSDTFKRVCLHGLELNDQSKVCFLPSNPSRGPMIEIYDKSYAIRAIESLQSDNKDEMFLAMKDCIEVGRIGRVNAANVHYEYRGGVRRRGSDYVRFRDRHDNFGPIVDDYFKRRHNGQTPGATPGNRTPHHNGNETPKAKTPGSQTPKKQGPKGSQTPKKVEDETAVNLVAVSAILQNLVDRVGKMENKPPAAAKKQPPTSLVLPGKDYVCYAMPNITPEFVNGLKKNMRNYGIYLRFSGTFKNPKTGVYNFVIAVKQDGLDKVKTFMFHDALHPDIVNGVVVDNATGWDRLLKAPVA